LAEVEGQIARLEALLASEFSQKAPEAVVEKEKSRLQEYLDSQGKLQRQLAALPGE
jgi:valyl-tRNA synthetase